MSTIAIRAVRKAGSFISKNYENIDFKETTQKGIDNFIINFNRNIEQLIIEIIRKSYPKHSIISKESGTHIGIDKYIQWIIYPLDGILNFIKHFPHFSVSIAVLVKGRTEVSVVYDPIRNELFTASRGNGGQLNGYRLRSNYNKNLYTSILAINFPFKNKKNIISYIKIINTLFTKFSDFRYTGSSLLDLAYVAAGRLDGFFKITLKPYVFYAGELLIRESGGLITNFINNYNYISITNIVAGNPYVVNMILSILRSELYIK